MSMTDLSREEKRIASELRGDWKISREDEGAIFGHLSVRFNTSDWRDDINQIVSSYINSHYKIFLERYNLEERAFEEIATRTTLYNEKVYLDVPQERRPVAGKSYRVDEGLVRIVDDYIERFAEDRGLLNGAVLREISQGGIELIWLEGIDDYLWECVGYEYSEMYLSFLRKRFRGSIEIEKVERNGKI